MHCWRCARLHQPLAQIQAIAVTTTPLVCIKIICHTISYSAPNSEKRTGDGGHDHMLRQIKKCLAALEEVCRGKEARGRYASSSSASPSSSASASSSSSRQTSDVDQLTVSLALFVCVSLSLSFSPSPSLCFFIPLSVLFLSRSLCLYLLLPLQHQALLTYLYFHY